MIISWSEHGRESDWVLYKVAHSFFLPCQDQEQERIKCWSEHGGESEWVLYKVARSFFPLCQDQEQEVQCVWYNDGTITATGV